MDVKTFPSLVTAWRRMAWTVVRILLPVWHPAADEDHGDHHDALYDAHDGDHDDDHDDHHDDHHH